ncbi:MAG: hypothetical protein AAGF44_04035 [Pseudomonadota bacterium]
MAELGLMCLMALEDWQPFDEQTLRLALEDLPQPVSARITAHPAGEEESALAITVDRQDFVAVVMHGPIPEPDFSQAIDGSVFWPVAADKMAGHNAFMALTAETTEDTPGLVRAQSVAMTRLAAALCETLPVMGVCWRSAEAAVPPSKLRRAVDQIAQGTWPVDMWIGYDVHYGTGEKSEQIGAFTRGAQDYLGCEVEIAPMPVQPEVPLRILSSTVSQLIDTGMYLRDGQEVTIKGVSHSRWKIAAGTTGRARITPAGR